MGKASAWGRGVGCLALGMLLLALGLPWAATAVAQEPTTIVKIESPVSGTPASTRLMISGWAVDPGGDGAGVDVVQLYLGDPQAGGQLLGTATYGRPHPDVADLMGDPRFTNSGFEMAVELPAGRYTLYVYAHVNALDRDSGWVTSTVTFQAAANVQPDPRALALLGGDQPQVRTAAPPTTQSTASSTSRQPSTGSMDGGGLRIGASSRADPMPLDPLGTVGASGSFISPGRDGPDLVDSMGQPYTSPNSTGGVVNSQGIRQSVASDTNAGTYRTGQVNMVGGSGTQCPGPNCPAQQANLTNTLNNLPPDLVREITGYNIPGLGTAQACTPSTGGTGGCNPTTGTANNPNAPSTADQMRQRLTQQMNSTGQNSVQSPVNNGPTCAQYGTNGQCNQVMGQTGFNGSQCLRWTGSSCTYYGQAPQQAGASTPTGAGALPPGSPSGVMSAQQSAAVQSSANSVSNPQQAAMLQQAAGLPAAGTSQTGSGQSGYIGSGYINGGGSGYINQGGQSGQSGYLPSGSVGQVTSPTSSVSTTPLAATTLAGTNTATYNPYAPSAATTTANYSTAAPAASTGGACMQFGPSGQCMR